MRFGITRKIGLLLTLPLMGAVVSVATFVDFRRTIEDLAPTMNVAGRQRLLISEMMAWADMVALGQEEDRAGLAARIAAFEQALVVLAHGSQLDGRAVAPTPRELAPALLRIERTWQSECKPHLLAIAERPADEVRAAAIRELHRSGDTLLRDSNAYVDALERNAGDATRNAFAVIAAVAFLDVALVLAAIWFARRQLAQPLAALTAAAARVQKGDFAIQLPARAQDELGVLAAAFNDAAREIGRLLAEEAHYHDVIEHLGDAVVMASLDARITYANRSAERMLGRRRDELVGTSLWLLIPGKYRAYHERAFARVAAGGSAAGRTLSAEALRADGSLLPVEMSVSAHHIGDHLVFTGVLRDVSERVQLTARMMQMDRMIAVGTLAAGVAHEINNPLAFIVANLGYLAEELPKLERSVGQAGGAASSSSSSGSVIADLAEAVKDGREGAERVRVIVRDLKSFSRSADEQRGPVDVRRVLESSINMAWNEIRHRARLVKDFAEVPPVDANEARLGQVCLNLLVNAAQAIAEGNAAANEIRLTTRRDGDSSVLLEIRDTGGGIPAETLPRIFDPFFTTKPVGQGTGLGLAICQGIVHGLGGSITVESEVGKGTTFRVNLPAAKETLDGLQPEPEPAPRPEAVRHRATILVVDDEQSICLALRRLLDSEFDLTCTNNGRAALELLQGGAAFDVILCDLMMPEMTGMALYDELARSRPGEEQRLIFLSGGAFTPKARDFLDRVPNPRVDKPFDPHALRSVVRERLGFLQPAPRPGPHRPASTD